MFMNSIDMKITMKNKNKIFRTEIETIEAYRNVCIRWLLKIAKRYV